MFRAFANPHAVQKETTDCHGLNRLPRMISARNSRLSVFSSRRNADQTARLGNASVPACWMPSCPVGCLPRCPAARRATATQRRSPGVAPCDPGTRRFRTARADGRNHCLSRNQRRIHQLRGGCSAGDAACASWERGGLARVRRSTCVLGARASRPRAVGLMEIENVYQFSQRLNPMDGVEHSRSRAPHVATEMNFGLRFAGRGRLARCGRHGQESMRSGILDTPYPSACSASLRASDWLTRRREGAERGSAALTQPIGRGCTRRRTRASRALRQARTRVNAFGNA